MVDYPIGTRVSEGIEDYPIETRVGEGYGGLSNRDTCWGGGWWTIQ